MIVVHGFSISLLSTYSWWSGVKGQTSEARFDLLRRRLAFFSFSFFWADALSTSLSHSLSLSPSIVCLCVCRLTIDGQLILGLRSVLSWLCCGHHWSPLMIGWVCMCCCFPSLSLFMHVHETLTPKDNILIETIMRSHPPILSLNLNLWGRKIFFVKLFKCSLKIFPMKRTNCSSFPF